jgi:hypothetical protein
MMKQQFCNWLFCGIALASGGLRAQNPVSSAPAGELHLRLALPQLQKHRAVPAVVWLEPRTGTALLPFSPRGHYTLLQKNRTFVPHLQVLPVGSVVQFPNADPFFHNVFSLFDGRRFDLGLYEAGSSKSVTFSREGVSYIFCNIHPEMSAVILALSTPLYAVASESGSFVLRSIPAGDYDMHLWIEGVPQPVLDSVVRVVHLSARSVDLGTLSVASMPDKKGEHKNMFGNPYDQHPQSPY